MNKYKKTSIKYYRFFLCEISAEELNSNHSDLYRFLQIYQSDLLAKMTEIYKGTFDENNSKYCLDEKIAKTITNHAINACKYHRSIDDVVDKIKFDWGVKILPASSAEDPSLADAKDPRKIIVKYPVFKEVVINSCKFAKVENWNSLEIYIDKGQVSEKCNLKNKVHFHHQNNRLRIYVVGTY